MDERTFGEAEIRLNVINLYLQLFFLPFDGVVASFAKLFFTQVNLTTFADLS